MKMESLRGVGGRRWRIPFGCVAKDVHNEAFDRAG
jgi:hypothetical protein